MGINDTPLSELTVDFGKRPTAPRLKQVTETQRQSGRHLAAIHRHYLMDLARLHKILERIQAGDEPPERLKQVVLSMEMSENYRAFGNLCGQQCLVLDMHHNIEETHMFPTLQARAATGFLAIIERLKEEHKVVHTLIERLYESAERLNHTPSENNFQAAANIFEALLAAVKSHFKYEETELEEALGYYGMNI
ncbi:hemerythrin domain-containing protein [Parasulfitobacter algicola]|uniref:Hemerythrin domain-containing protein n=1 Tax=Parasulfitobacter algicola TaxID=2614809 RepID=A0ABX2IWK2_9RHOB|nr:hemerythrin domain-containing protein [Sulfitobacter algicola]NSX56441.1 hemerythrin domain-containing protein [Sulfitobacter algicola]